MAAPFNSQAAMKNQDDILDNIGRGLDRQKAAAQGMHSEISRQKDVMGNGLDKDVDSAMTQLLAATKKANELRAQSGFFWMYIACFVLFALLILLIFLGANADEPSCPSPASTHSPVFQPTMAPNVSTP